MKAPEEERSEVTAPAGSSTPSKWSTAVMAVNRQGLQEEAEQAA
jgi:hypothetical protein